MTKHHITLSEHDHEALSTRVSTGKAAAAALTRARMLLLSDTRKNYTDAHIVEALTVGLSTLERVKARYHA